MTLLPLTARIPFFARGLAQVTATCQAYMPGFFATRLYESRRLDAGNLQKLTDPCGCGFVEVCEEATFDAGTHFGRYAYAAERVRLAGIVDHRDDICEGDRHGEMGHRSGITLADFARRNRMLAVCGAPSDTSDQDFYVVARDDVKLDIESLRLGLANEIDFRRVREDRLGNK